MWLVGLSGSGKSTVGPLVAQALGYEFLDLDRLIEAEAGDTIAGIFRSEGESGFRRREAEEAGRWIGKTAIVVATGAGWMARTDVRRAWRGCVRVWLRVAPFTAAARLDRGGERRPMLEAGERVRRLEELLEQRAPRYAEAEIVVDTDRLVPGEVARLVVERLGGDSGTDAGLSGGHDGEPEENAMAEESRTQ